MAHADRFKSNPTPEQFAKFFTKFAVKNGFTKELTFDPTGFRLLGGEGKITFNLHNAYNDYCAMEGEARDKILSKYVQTLSTPEIPGDFATAQKSLMPIIRGRSMVEQLRLMGKLKDRTDDAEPAFKPFSNDAVLMLAFDSEHSIQTISAATLQRWGVSFDEARNAAVSNLRDRSISKFSQLDSELFASDWNDGYDASRILLPDVTHRLGVGENPVVMMPLRDILFVASSASEDALADMVAAAAKVTENDGRLVSALMYQVQDSGVVEYSPHSPKVKQALHELKLHFLSSEYRSQGSLLQQVYQKEGANVLVADFAVGKSDKANQSISAAQWIKDFDISLPKTDFILLLSSTEVGKDTVGKMVSWDEAWKTVGHFMKEEQGIYPPRYRVAQFPSQAQLDAMAAADL